ncbi:uncharacterized protein BO96DRAFT_415550 [Aspergillus niger CBS 101883]|uniref:uncharacterized protein n=1 Tax=Aspergillus lacticoffeatus (strain CBS 101883) TaxID=1450533 RepID=UPI000D7F3B7F|nr:uncharacterized protein BO96DRAFT_415550 [Aspergillus niger CBS 101883]PYH52451.1 hypothetical protein BO96DRAFT_415550 [Aspergillus niger CBS 101883]
MLQAFVERCVETGTDGHTDKLDQAMQDVKSIIGQLSRITTSIRKAGTNARIQKADASYDPDHPQVKALRIHLQLLLLSRPTNNGTLRVLISSHGVVLTSPVDETIVTDSRSLTVIQQRLIEANLKRRNRFLYAQRHAIKLSDGGPTVSTSIQTPQKAPLPPGANPFARSTEEPELPKVYSTTTATDVQDPIQLPTRSSVQPTTTVISAISSRVTYPKPPPLRSDQNIFQCPCCCQTLPASVGRGSQWKKHLSRDILPYTCILEDCPRPERLYHTKDLWLSHMFTDHGGIPHWVCLACNGSSEQRVFFEDSALTEHLEQKHSRGIKPQQIPMLASAWRRKQPPSIESCPLCGLTDPDFNVILNHVAEHLHAFSLRSLPWAQGDFERNGNSYGGYYEDHPYFDTGRSDDTGSVGSGSTESSEQMSLEDLPVMESRKMPTENNQLTEDKIRYISEYPNGNQDMMAAFLAGIENQDPVTAPFQTSPSAARSDSRSPITEERIRLLMGMSSLPSPSVPDPRYLDRDHSSAIRAPLPAPSDSESFTNEEDEHQAILSHQPASSSPARPRSDSNEEPASPGFLSPSVAQEEFLSPALSRYADLDGTSITRVMKAEGAIKGGAEAAGFLSGSGMLSRHITLPQGNARPGELSNFSLVIYDEDDFQHSLATLFGKCSRWVSMLLEHSNNAPCLSLGELTFEHIADRFRNAILDGSDVDGLLANPLYRKNTFISVTMTMVWEFIFTRYLFGLERPIRSAIKRLEKELAQSLPRKVVYRWRATTLHLLAQDIELKEQQGRDIEAISITIVDTLMAMLPVARPQEHPLRKELHGVLRSAVDLSFEMRTQLADYIMLPPLQPEFDSQGNLTSQIFLNSSLMHDQSGVYASDEEAEAEHAVVRLVLFPLVVKKGDDQGKGDEEVVVYPAQVVVAEKQSKRSASETEIEAQAPGSPGGTDYLTESNAQSAEDAEVKEQRKAETFDLKDKLRATKRSRERLPQQKVELMPKSQERAHDASGESRFSQNKSIESPVKETEENHSTSPGFDTSFPGLSEAAVWSAQRDAERSFEILKRNFKDLKARKQKRAYDVPGGSRFSQNECIESPAKEEEESPPTSHGADTSFPGQNDAAVDSVFSEIKDTDVML